MTTTEPAAKLAALTNREATILGMMSDGMTNIEIGSKLFLSENTVKSHQRSLFKKLRAKNRTHCVSIAHRIGLVGPGGWRVARHKARAGWWVVQHDSARQETGATKNYEEAAATCLRLLGSHPNGLPHPAPEQ